MSWRFRPIVRTFADFYVWLFPLAVINLIWLGLSMTVVLLPPATAALYDVAYRATQHETPEISSYLRAVRTWFFKSWVWAIFTALIVVIWGVAFFFYSTNQSSLAVFLSGFVLLGGIIFLGIQFYFWPYMVMIEKPGFGQIIRNATLTLLANPFYALVNAGLAIILWALSFFLLAPIAFITPALVAFLSVYSLRGWLTHHGFLDQNSDVIEESIL